MKIAGKSFSLTLSQTLFKFWVDFQNNSEFKLQENTRKATHQLGYVNIRPKI